MHKRAHKGLAEQKIDRSISDYVRDEGPVRPVVARLAVERAATHWK
jgi:hypothetical protein